MLLPNEQLVARVNQWMEDVAIREGASLSAKVDYIDRMSKQWKLRYGVVAEAFEMWQEITADQFFIAGRA